MSTKDFMIEGRKDRKNNGYFKTARKKILAILAIIMLLMQYIVVPTYATASSGSFTASECPYDIEFTTINSGWGSRKTAAIDKDGNIWTWGNHSMNSVSERTPKRITSGTKFVQVSLAGNFIIAIDQSGYLWSNGNDYGIDSSITDFHKLTGISNTFSSVAIGSEQRNSIAYPFILAIDKSGNLYSWGINQSGQLGDGSNNDSNTPKMIMSGTRVSKISIGNAACMAIDQSGYLYTWGSNTFGGLGDGTTNNRNTPQKILSDKTFNDIGAGNTIAIALDRSGNVWTWGNEYGGSTPRQISSGFSQISIGSEYYMALDRSGYLYTWGKNSYGQLGNGTSNTATSPRQIMSGKRFNKISAGQSTGRAIDIDGNMWTWGYNSYGNIGDGTSSNPKTTPIQITGKYYTVNFYNEQGTSITQTKRVQSGASATTGITTPTKQSTQQYTYRFSKWVSLNGSSVNLSSVTSDLNVKPLFNETLRSYTVSFRDYNGQNLESKSVNYGSKAEYNGVTPSKSKYGYICTFKGWDKDPNNTTITGDTVFTAQYDEEIATYTISYNLRGGSLETENPDTYNIETEDFTLNNPTLTGYTFQGWRGTGIEGILKIVTVHKRTNRK